MNRRSTTVLSRRDLDERYGPAMRDVKRYVSSARDSSSTSKDVANIATDAVGVGVGAAAIGALAGRMGTTEISGVPIGLAAGVAGHVASYFAPSWLSGHLHNVSNGAIAGWLTLWGAGQGTRMRQAAGEPIGPIVAGVPAQHAMGGYPPPMPPPGYAGMGQQPPYMPPPPQMGAAPPPAWYQRGADPRGEAQAQFVEAPLTEAELQAIAMNQRTGV